MKAHRLVLLSIAGFCGLAGLPATPAGFDDAAAAGPPAPAYERRDLEGWTVQVRRELVQTNSPATEHALELLRKQLAEIVRVVSAPALKELRLVPLYFSPEYPGRQPTAEYHPDAGWLKANGRDSAMAKAVEFSNVRQFEAEMDRMPNFVLHELAHAYHHRVLPGGFNNPELKAAYERARMSGKYDRVERRSGGGRPNTFERAYGINDAMEYFAETTEAFFGRNDFYPFTRDELKAHDPEMFALLGKLWGTQQGAGVDSGSEKAPMPARPGGLMADSPVTFPREGALPAKYPPDVKVQDEPAEKDYFIFSSPCRSLNQIAAIQKAMPPGQFTPPPADWKHLPRTRRILTEGGELRLLALGDSIVNDTMRSGWVAQLQEAYPQARIQTTVYVRGGGGCQHYREEDRVAKYILPRKPDLVFIGGISQRDIESIREVIRQLRAGLPDVEILLATGAFGTVDPRDPVALAQASHSGTGEYGQALKSLAAEQHCAYLDMTTPWAEYLRSAKVHPHLFYRDPVHANEFGEQVLAKIMTAFWTASDQTESAERIVFPSDPSVLDLKRDFGAKGDGVADDTAALQAAIEASSNRGRVGGTAVLFIPNGTYRVTSNLVVNSRVGPWVYGESRNGVVIRLADGVATNVTAVLRTQPSDTQASSADYFMRNFRHLTIDVGQNPNTDGIRWYGNNSSILKDVRLMGAGRVGINAGFLGQNGPSLVQDALVEGSFETGVRCAWSWGQTLSRVTVRNARSEGVYVNATAVGIDDLVVENTPVALRNEYPNDWTWWGGVVALVGGRFSGSDPAQPAITNSSVLYARDVTSRGFKQILSSTTPGGSVGGTGLQEYLSHPAKKLFADAPDTSLNLPIKREPHVAWETNLANWVCANDHGAKFGDNQDHTAALQAAIDAAAAAGKTVVYLRGIGGGDPNWYNLNGEVRVHGSVRFIMGLGFGRVIGGEIGRFIVDDRSAPVVKFLHLQAFGGRPAIVENRSATNTLVVESCDLKVLGTGGGDIFVTDCPSGIELQSPLQSLWARQLNPEGDSDTGLVQNHGGRLWALGVKHEGRGVRFLTDRGGQTEILGLFNYAPSIATNDFRPAFDIRDAVFSAQGVRELSFGNTYPVKVREQHGNDVRTEQGGGWIGWALFRSGTNRTASTGLRAAPGSPSFPLKVSENRRHLVDQRGTPFLYHADTPWMIFLKLTEAEAKEYIARRREQGFNTLQVQLTGFLGMTNRAGELPFAGTPPEQDFAQPNEPFFAHVDRVVAEAGRQGLLLAIAPAWSGCCGEGWAGKEKDSRPKPLNANGPVKAREFGRWLGGRYGKFANVLWILGGDNDPHNAREEIRALGLGLKDTAPHQLITYHAASSHSSTDVWPANELWLDVAMVYSYFRGFNKAWNKNQPDIYEVSHAEFAKTPLRPFFLGESTYEGEHGAWGSALQARKQAYWCMLGGGMGHAYGSPNWNMPANWREVLELPGANSLKHLRALLASRPWWKLVPDVDNVVTVEGRGDFATNDYAVTALADDGSFALSFLPSKRALTTDLTKLTGSRLSARWFNPRTGESTFIGEFSDKKRHVFDPPNEGDWVLVLDDAAKRHPAP